MNLTLTIDRSSLSLSDLVITGNGSTSMWIPQEGVGRPSKTPANQYAQARFLNGTVLTSSRLEQADIPLTVYVQGTSTSDLVSLQDELEAALGQFTYTVEVSVDGVARTWQADPASIGWGPLDSGMARIFLARATVTIPVFPVEV